MAEKSSPQRMCIACREFKDKRALLRIVRTPEGALAIDPSGKQAGRGAYLCRDAACLKKALKNRALEKALRCKVDEAMIEAITKAVEESGC